MRRRGYVPGATALLTALLVSCTGGSEGDASSGDAKGGGSGTATSTASSGKHQTLPDPCRAVDRSTLEKLLPGLKELPDTRRKTVYTGTPTVTYDTDRRGGCRWKLESSDAVRHLHIDFERVVSYDSQVSDDERAERVYGKKSAAADIPAPDTTDGGGNPSDGADTKDDEATKAADGEASPTPTDATPSPDADASPDPSDTPDTGTGTGTGTDEADATPSSDTDTDTDDTPSPTGLEPRTLDDLADQAFLDDQLTVAGSAARLRTVTVVFRTSNVLVTIAYDEQPTRGGVEPDSEELQDRARKLADSLAETFG
ncbi:DUF3558 domain-containing protein [Streptomyces sp. O3]